MKKLVTIASIMLALGAVADPPMSYSMTNAMAWVGIDINASNVSNLPRRVSSTPGDALLGLMRTFMFNDCEDFLFHLSPAKRMQYAGTTEHTNIPSPYRISYESSPVDTNLLIKSCLPISTNGAEFTISLELQEINHFEVIDETAIYKMLFTNGQWKINGTIHLD